MTERNFHIRLRLIISAVIFVLWTIYIFYTGNEDSLGFFVQFWIIPQWILAGIVIALFLPFASLIFEFGIYIILAVFVIAVGYGVFLAMPTIAGGVAEYIKTNIGKVSLYSDIGLVVFALFFGFLFAIPYIYRRHKEKQANAEARIEERISSWQAEEGAVPEKTNVLEKGEIARVVNYWQQKFNNATNEEERKSANDKIRYYTELLSSLNDAKKGKEVIRNE
jgi:cbb3-type cytochrome oxidase subunit 3